MIITEDTLKDNQLFSSGMGYSNGTSLSIGICDNFSSGNGIGCGDGIGSSDTDGSGNGYFYDDINYINQ